MEGDRGSAKHVAGGLRGGELVVMRVYSSERFWLYFYCATAPTASENAKRFCEMAAL